MQKTNHFNKFNRFHLSGLVLLCGMAIASQLNADTQTGRYISVVDEPTAEQKYVLRFKRSFTFSEDINTVGDAMSMLLAEPGYRLGTPTSDKESEELLALFKMPLASIHRQLGPMTLKDALETLAGPAWFLVEDPVARLISFERCTLGENDQ